MNFQRNKKSPYDQYLDTLHAQLITPEDVIREVIKDATGKQFADKKRIVAGETNEVYCIFLEDGNEVVLRISRKENDFDQEKWAIEQCEKIGVPVPEVLGIKHLTLDNNPLSFCVQRKVEGEPLDRGGIDYHQLDPGYIRRITAKAGEILSKIHSIPTHGFGYINGKGEGSFKSFYDLMSEKIERSEDYLKLARDSGLDQEVMQKALRIFSDHLEGLVEIEPRLSHGDYAFKHFMVKGEEITAILDWGEATGNSPTNDFARWDFWFGKELSVSLLQAGYLNKKLFTGDFEETLYWFRINIGLENLNYYHSQNYEHGVETVKKKLLEDIKYFS